MDTIEQKFERTETQIQQYLSEGKKLFASSSFQSHSIPLVHIIGRIDNSIPIYFINTGYHFPETVDFKDQLAKDYNLNIVDLKSTVSKNMQRDANGNLYFASDPDFCCHINKVQPMDSLLLENDIWINGVRADQNANRRNMKVEQDGKHGTKRYHPMLDWTTKDIYQYSKEFNLPKHPLEEKGYLSVGCEPCTRKFDFGDVRTSRWFGMKKTECGLHTDLATK